MTDPRSTPNTTTATRWWPDHDPEPGPGVLAVAVAGEAPSWYRWERMPDGWAARGRAAPHTRHTPPRRWSQIGDRRHPDEPYRSDLRPILDVTGDLGTLCPECDGYGCHPGCGWSGRRDWPKTERR